MRRALSVIASIVLLLTLAGAADGANPHQTSTFSVCYDSVADHLVMNQTWSAIRVDEVSFGIGDGQQGLGVEYPIRASRSGNETVSLGFDPTATIAGGSLLVRGMVVADHSMNVPAGGWSTLPAC
jgi:hypothetical protein